MPKLIRFYILHCLIGFAIAGAFTGAVLWFNVANIGHLVSSSPIGWLAITVFWVLNGLVFAGVQFAVAVMLMADKDEDPPGGTALPVTAPVRVGPR
jgi:hypothetical protein